MRPTTVLVTGSTDGIGLTTAKNLAAAGHNVLLHGRDERRIERARQTVEAFVKQQQRSSGGGGGKAFALPPTDVSTVDGCVRLAHAVEKKCEKYNLGLSVLMNNAGVYSGHRAVTADGLELTFAVNVMAPFVITSLLLRRLLKQPSSRIVIASSMVQAGSIGWHDLHYSNQRRYNGHLAYSESKLLDTMLTMEMADRLKRAHSNKITCNCLHPGVVGTKMLAQGWGANGMNPDDALDEAWLCSSDKVERATGKYFLHRQQQRAPDAAYDRSERAKLWTELSRVAPEAAAMWNL